MREAESDGRTRGEEGPEAPGLERKGVPRGEGYVGVRGVRQIRSPPPPPRLNWRGCNDGGEKGGGSRPVKGTGRQRWEHRRDQAVGWDRGRWDV